MTMSWPLIVLLVLWIVGGVATMIFTIGCIAKTDALQDWDKATHRDVIVIGLTKALLILLSLFCYPLFWGLIMWLPRRRVVVTLRVKP